MNDLVPGFMKFVTRPLYGVILRVLACGLVVVAIIAAAMDAAWAGFTPAVWLLLALAALVGVICNLMSQMMCHKGVGHHGDGKHAYAGHHGEAAEAHKATVVAEVPAAKAAPAKPETAQAVESPPVEVEIYCVKCRTKRMIKDPAKVTLANGRPAQQGACPVCGTKVTRLLKVG